MRYLSSLGAGLAGAVLAVVLYLAMTAVQVALIIAWQRRSGSGGIGAVSSGLGPVLVAALIGFAVGAWSGLRRRPPARIESK